MPKNDLPIDWIRDHLPATASSITVVSRRPVNADALDRLTRHVGTVRTLVLQSGPQRVAVRRLHVALSSHPRSDVVLDVALGRGVAARSKMLAQHLTPGGRLLARVPKRAEVAQPLVQLVRKLHTLQARGKAIAPTHQLDRKPTPRKDRRHLAHALDQLELDASWLVAQTRTDALRVLSEQATTNAIRATPAFGRELAREKATAWKVPHRTRYTHPEVTGRERTLPLTLRAFDDVIVRPLMVAHKDDTVLPHSFRNPQRPRPRMPTLIDWSPWSVVAPDDLGGRAPVHRLPGVYLHADSNFRGHFGHAMTEQLGHLWAWDRALAAYPDLRLLVSSLDKPVAAWELDILEAAGVERDRVVTIEGPVEVDTLVTSTPGYVISRYIHPALRPVYARTGAALAARHTGTEPLPDKIFVTRRHGKRACTNAEEVEALFVNHGFTVIAPEEHPLPEQVAMARGASSLAGFAGSGLFHLLFATEPKRVLVVASETYPATNERQIAAFGGHDLTLVRGRSEVAAVAETFTTRSFHSDYAIDWNAEGAVLKEELDRK